MRKRMVLGVKVDSVENERRKRGVQMEGAWGGVWLAAQQAVD